MGLRWYDETYEGISFHDETRAMGTVRSGPAITRQAMAPLTPRRMKLGKS